MGRANWADIKGNDFSRLGKETKTNTEESNKVSNTNTDRNRNTTSSDSRGRRSRRRNRRVTMLHPVQRLFNTCKDVFAFSGPGIVPTPDKIERLRAVLDNIRLSDVGLSRQVQYFSPQVTGRAPTITYIHIYECEKFSMGIFCLPPSGVLPLHNHPGMTVFSKLLFGTMHIKSYDWVVDVPSNASAIVDPSQMQHPGIRLAKVKVDADFTAPCEPSILYPADGGNMHCFTAVTACAVLDVLGPPYADNEGRHCTYYFDYPFTTFSADGVTVPEEDRDKYAWLQEREKPDDLDVDGAPYTGPEIREN